MLPREVDLAAEFGVSRGVARECIRAMEERGLVLAFHGIANWDEPSLAAIDREDLKQLWAGKLVTIMKAAFKLAGIVVDENRLRWDRFLAWEVCLRGSR